MKIIFRYDYFDEEFYGYEEMPVEEELTPQFQTSPSKLKVRKCIDDNQWRCFTNIKITPY